MIADFVLFFGGLLEIAVGASCMFWPSWWATRDEKPIRIRRLRCWGALWLAFGTLMFTASILSQTSGS